MTDPNTGNLINPTEWLQRNPGAPQWLRDLVELFIDAEGEATQ